MTDKGKRRIRGGSTSPGAKKLTAEIGGEKYLIDQEATDAKNKEISRFVDILDHEATKYAKLRSPKFLQLIRPDYEGAARNFFDAYEKANDWKGKIIPPATGTLGTSIAITAGFTLLPIKSDNWFSLIGGILLITIGVLLSFYGFLYHRIHPSKI